MFVIYEREYKLTYPSKAMPHMMTEDVTWSYIHSKGSV